MNSLDFLHYVVSFAVIIIAATIVAIGIILIIVLNEVKKAFHAVKKTSEGIQDLKNSIQYGIIGSIFTFGKSIFSKKKSS